MRRTARIAAVVTGSFLLLMTGLSLWNLVVTRWQHAHTPVPGNFYSVFGRQMHLNCSGAGSPTLLIEAGAGADSFGWMGIQQKLSPLARVCTYDRAGHGWSEPRSGPRDAEAIAHELHALLELAGVPRPLVFAGHSAGGLYVREYAREFPSEVAGVVLIDSSSPQQIDELPGFRQSYEQDKHSYARELRWEKLRVWSGWERLMGRCENEPSPELKYLKAQYDAKMCRPAYVGGDDNEFMDFETTCHQAGRLTTFGNVPLLVISRSPAVDEGGAEISIWDGEQGALKSLSPQSWQVIARGAGHAVHHDRPDLVVAEITKLINYLRGRETPPFGSTLTE
jgi:pimeloyl-ACP methyl ester carboxylesterase